MSHHDEWTTEPPRLSWLGRLIAAPGSTERGGRPVSGAFLVGAMGVVAFVASLVLDWQRITITPVEAGQGPGRSSTSLTAGAGTVDTLTFVYIVGAMALLGLLGAVITRPDLAARLRTGAAGVTVGLLGVLVAITLRLPETVLNAQDIIGSLYGGIAEQFRDNIQVAYEPGLFCGFGAIALPMAAIWLAGGRTARALVDQPTQPGERAQARHHAEPADNADIPVPGGPPVGANGGRLSVTASEPLDLSVTPDPRGR